MLQTPFYPALADDDHSSSVSYQQQIEADAIAWESSTIFGQINELEETILNSPRVPLTGKTMVNEEELLQQLDILRSSVPASLKAAQEILEYKNQIIKEAQQQAQQLLAEANRQAYQVANELGIIDRAEVEAEQMRQMTIAECEQMRQQITLEVDRIRHHNIQEMERMREVVLRECQQIQDGADEYADRVLSEMEFQLNDVLRAIQRGKQHLNIESQSLRNPQPSARKLTNLDDRVMLIEACASSSDNRA